MKRHGLMAALFIFLSIFAFAGISPAEDLTKVRGGIKAVLKPDPSRSMVDLYLYDMTKAHMRITEATVYANIKTPGGKILKKELVGMEMGDAYSFMNSLDMKKKGRYSFDIEVEFKDKKTAFSFSYDVR